MNFYEEREMYEKLIQDKSKLVFWKKDAAVQKNNVIVCEKVWTTDSGYLLGNKMYEFGTDKFLCESWIDENYLEEVSNGKNIVVID